jgi:hypothetical protein
MNYLIPSLHLRLGAAMTKGSSLGMGRPGGGCFLVRHETHCPTLQSGRGCTCDPDIQWQCADGRLYTIDCGGNASAVAS